MKKIFLFAFAGLAACSTHRIVENDFDKNDNDRGVAQASGSMQGLTQALDASKKYIIIQNVATERTRVYEKCYVSATENCANGNRLVFETEMVVGRNADEMHTAVGVQRINIWRKFKETKDVYPSWYAPGYPDLPKPDKGFGKWFKNSAMPNGKGEMRGAFGWYTAEMNPGGNGQWAHGTVGWGADGDKFIKAAHGGGLLGKIANVFADQRSHGCTRHENRAIAYLQSLVPAGTTLIKIYAREDLADSSLQRYSSQQQPLKWDWILTKEDVQSTNPKSSTAELVQKRLESGAISQNDILESGSYEVDQYPEALPLRKKSEKSGKSGDAYSVGAENFSGVFYVDEGRVSMDYKHPRELPQYGLPDYNGEGKQPVPDYMLKRQ